MTAILSERKLSAKPERCRKCGHAWFKKTSDKPRQCPNCWARDWERKNGSKKG